MAKLTKNNITFSWTGKGVELLLESVKVFKVNMEAERLDWESLRTIYDKIMEIVHKNYPKPATLKNFRMENVYKSCTKHVLQAK